MNFLFDPTDIGTWTFLNELNLGTNQISKLPDDIACLQNLEVNFLYFIIPSEYLHLHILISYYSLLW